MFFDRCYAQSQRLSSLLADISTLTGMDAGKDLHGKEAGDLARGGRALTKKKQKNKNNKKKKNNTTRCPPS